MAFVALDACPLFDQLLWGFDIGHGELMLEACLLAMEGGAAEEDGLAILDGTDASGREAAAIARAVHFENNRDFRITRSVKRCMRRGTLLPLFFFYCISISSLTGTFRA